MIKEERGNALCRPQLSRKRYPKKKVMLISDFWLRLTQREILNEMSLIAEAFRFFGKKIWAF